MTSLALACRLNAAQSLPSKVARMVAALRRLGGRLWMVDNAFSGAFVDNVGTTPMTAVGDLVGLLTDRSYGAGNLGVELVTDPTVSNPAAWVSSGVGSNPWTANTGSLACTATSTGNRWVALSGLSLVVGKAYRIECDCIVTAGGFLPDVSGTPVYRTVSGRAGWTLTASTAAFQFLANNAFIGSIDNITAKEVLGTPATQSAVASKSSVQRVPKRLGPNLVVNGTFDADTGWTKQAGWAISGGVATCDGSTGFLTAVVPTPVLEIGKWYTASFSLVSRTSGTVYLPYDGTGLVATSSTTPGSYSHTFLCDSALRPMIYSQAFVGEIDNIAVQEVLEWANVISFDGSNDFLQTGITTGNEGFVAAGVTFGGAAGANETVACSGAGAPTQKGVWLRRAGVSHGENSFVAGVCDGSTLYQAIVNSIPLRGFAHVVEGGWTTSSVYAAVDGVSNTVSKTGDATPPAATLGIGWYISGAHYMQGPMHAIAYTPVLPDAATRKIIRGGIAALQGRTL